MTDQSRTGGTVRPQSVVGPIALDKTHAGGAVAVQPNSVVGPVALGLERPVAVLEAACAAGTVTLAVESSGQRSRIIIAAPGSGAPAIPVAGGATLYAIARNDADLVILLDGVTPQVFFTLPVGDTAAVTVTVTDAAVT